MNIGKNHKTRLFSLLIMVSMLLAALPATAFALDTEHKISVDLYKVQIDSTKPLGYTTPEKVDTITVTCTDTTPHSGYNHFVKLSDFHPSNTGVAATDWSGWCFNGYFSLSGINDTFYRWTSSKVNATANVAGNEPYPCSKNFYYVYKETPPPATGVTMEISLLTTVELGGTVAPGPKAFEFEIASYGNPDIDISSLTITGTTVSTNGAGDYTETLTIVGDPDVIDSAEGLKLTEKNDGEAHWTYDDTTYIVYRDTGNGIVIQKNMGPNVDPQEVQTAAFVNTYTNNGDEAADPLKPNDSFDSNSKTAYLSNSGQRMTPQTGDDGTMLFWIALMFVSCGGVCAAYFGRKKRARSK